ncbi:hypothetical protein O988_04448 [Pseudogymnoascus sp. VKM F-3808]|nr:hypothetical protein O988_04448 [Pseudogymnoascus sp. VKM F-3808]
MVIAELCHCSQCPACSLILSEYRSFYRAARIASCVVSIIAGQFATPITSTTPRATRSFMSASNQIHRAKTSEWNLPEGVFTPSEIVTGVSPLLLAVLSKLGNDPPGHPSSKKLLLDNLANSLSTSSRESTMPIKDTDGDSSRQEIQAQANTIGTYLVEQARKLDLENPNLNIDIRSPCEGHLWTRAVANLLMGPRSNGQLMQLFNEYLHQMVLLRDALLPFENYRDVRFRIQKSKSGPGLRSFEEARSALLMECLTRSVSQKTLIKVAKAFTAPDLPTGGYGFQYSSFVVLPAFLFGSTSPRLLRIHPAQIEKSEKPILFDYDYPDYYTAQRTEISQDIDVENQASIGTSIGNKYSLALEKSLESENNKRVLKLRLNVPEGSCLAVDVGQVARGWRFSTHLQHAPENTQTTTPPLEEKTTIIHKINNVLGLPGLVSSTDADTHIIFATNPLIRLALLGKLYPHNVFLAKGETGVAVAESFPEKFGGRFVIIGGESKESLNFAQLVDGELEETI